MLGRKGEMSLENLGTKILSSTWLIWRTFSSLQWLESFDPMWQKWKAVSDKFFFTTTWLEETTLEFFRSEDFLRHAKRLKKSYQIILRIEIWSIGQQPKVNFKAIFFLRKDEALGMVSLSELMVTKRRSLIWLRTKANMRFFFHIQDRPSDLGPSYLKEQKIFFFDRGHPVV